MLSVFFAKNYFHNNEHAGSAAKAEATLRYDSDRFDCRNQKKLFYKINRAELIDALPIGLI